MDDEKGKVVLNLFCKFMAKQGCSSALFEADGDGSLYNDTFYCRGEGNMKSPFPIEKFLEKLIDPHLVGSIDTDEGEAEVWAYEIYILPEKILQLVASATVYISGDTEVNDDEDVDSAVFEGLPQEKFFVEFAGGGDDGQIDDEGTSVDGGQLIGIDEPLMTHMYGMLENYGGWEINEGSQGRFYVDPTERTITLNFNWNQEETKNETVWQINFAD